MLSTFIKTSLFSALLFVVIDGGVIDIKTNGIQEENGVINSMFPGYHEVKEAVKELLDSYMSPRLTRYDCPWPYQRIADTCVYFTSFSESWQKSREYCWALNGDLATFRDENKLALMTGYMNCVASYTFWVGGSRPNSSYDFVWLNGADLPGTSSPFWNYRNEDGLDCVFLSRTQYAYKLENANCSRSSNPSGVPRYILCSLL